MEIGGIVFNGFDVVVLGVVLVSLLMAASRGIARELVSIIALAVSVPAALFIWGTFRPAAQDFIQPTWLADAALALGGFAGVYMIVVFLLSGLKKAMLGRDVTFAGRLLGAAFGAFRGLLVMALFVMVPTAAYIADRDRVREVDEKYEGRTDIPEDVMEDLRARTQSLPDWLESSSTYPILERIGDWIRALPIADIRTAADELRDGEIPDLSFEEESDV